MSETEKQKKRRDNVRNLRDINRALSRQLQDTQKYLSQQIKNIELERERYKKQVEELTRKLQNQKTIDTKDWNERLKNRTWGQGSRPCIGSRVSTLGIP